jgi:hypothetical protein
LVISVLIHLSDDAVGGWCRAMMEGGLEMVRHKMQMKMVEWGMGPEKLGEETFDRQLELLVQCCRILGTACPSSSIPAPITGTLTPHPACPPVIFP